MEGGWKENICYCGRSERGMRENGDICGCKYALEKGVG